MPKSLEEIYSSTVGTDTDGSSGVRSLDQIYNESMNTDTGTDTTTQTGTSDIGGMIESAASMTSKKSPATTWDRLEMSTLTIPQRQQYLQNRFQFVEPMENGKFIVGNDQNDMRAVDPEGMFNDVLGDIADVAGEIPVIAGQILGTIGGAVAEIPSGPIPTTVIGAGVGSAAGTGVKKLIGAGVAKRENIKQQQAMSMATDIAIEGLFGAAGEGIARGLSSVGKKVMLNRAGKLLSKGVNTTGDPSKSLSVLSKVFKVASGVDPSDTINAGMYDFEKVFTKKYLNADYLTDDVMPKFVKQILNKTDELGEATRVGKQWAINTFGKDSVQIAPISAEILEAMRHPSVGILDSAYRLNKGAFTEGVDYKTFKELTDLFFAKNPKTGQIVPKNLSVADIVHFKERIGSGMNTYFKSGRAKSGVKVPMAKFLEGVDEAVDSQISKELKGATNIYSSTRKAYSEWKSKLELMKANGLDVTDAKALRKAMSLGDDSVISSRMENFVEKLTNKTDSSQKIFKTIASELPSIEGAGIGGQAGTLFDEIVKYNAAQGFAKFNIDLLRFGALGGIISMATGTDIFGGEMPGPVQLGASVLLGTPAGNRIILKAGSKVANQLIKKGLREVGKGASKMTNTPVANAVLSRLLSKEFNAKTR